MRLTGLVLILGLLVLGAPRHGSAEIYRWTDQNGRIHFTQDLSQVPVDQRRASERKAQEKPGRSPIQVYDAPAARSRSKRAVGGGSTQASGRTYHIPVQRAGSSMRVAVRINDRLDVPFVLDTGATDVVLPSWAAKELGLDLASARTGLYRTANGVIEQKLVTLRSVSLGDARVENVPASVSDSMSQGLLGLSFFNHFKYHIDPVQGVVTLQRNRLAESGVLKGGRSAQQWAQQFALAHHRVALAEKMRDDVSSNRSRKRAEMEAQVERFVRELEQLESEADTAHVPFTWRD